eukprot:403335159
MKHQQLTKNKYQSKLNSSVGVNHNNRRKSSRSIIDGMIQNQQVFSAQQSIQQVFSPNKKIEEFNDHGSELCYDLQVSFDEMFHSNQKLRDSSQQIDNNEIDQKHDTQQTPENTYGKYETFKNDSNQPQTNTLTSSLNFNKPTTHNKSRSIASNDFQKALKSNIMSQSINKDRKVLQESFQNVQMSYQTLNNEKQSQYKRDDSSSSKNNLQQASAKFFSPNALSKNQSPLKSISRNPSKAETRYQNQISPSFAFDSNRNINQSFRGDEKSTNNQVPETFRSNQKSQKKKNLQTSRGRSPSNQSSISKKSGQNTSIRNSVISHSTNGTYYQSHLKNSMINQSRLTQNLFNGLNNTQLTSGGAASIIIQKIESTSQKVTNEIAENQKQFKEQSVIKRDLQKHIELIKIELQRLQKDSVKVQENIPQYADITSQLCYKISHKRSKSQDNVKELSIIKQQISQIESEKQQISLKRDQIKQNLKFEEIRIGNIQQKVQEMKLKIVQIQREKEKFIVEISKQSKVIKNQQQRLNTLSENSCKIYDNFEATTSRILNDKPAKKKMFRRLMTTSGMPVAIEIFESSPMTNTGNSKNKKISYDQQQSIYRSAERVSGARFVFNEINSKKENILDSSSGHHTVNVNIKSPYNQQQKQQLDSLTPRSNFDIKNKRQSFGIGFNKQNIDVSPRSGFSRKLQNNYGTFTHRSSYQGLVKLNKNNHDLDNIVSDAVSLSQKRGITARQQDYNQVSSLFKSLKNEPKQKNSMIFSSFNDTLTHNNQQSMINPEFMSGSQINERLLSPQSQNDISLNFSSSQRLKNMNLYTYMQSDYLNKKNRVNKMKYAKKFDLSKFDVSRKEKFLQQLQDELAKLRLMNNNSETDLKQVEIPQVEEVNFNSSQKSLFITKRSAFTANHSLLSSPRFSNTSLFDSKQLTQLSSQINNQSHNHFESQISLTNSMYDIDYLEEKRNRLLLRLSEKEQTIKLELQSREQLQQMKHKERRQKLADDFKYNELKPQFENYMQASKNFDRLSMLNNSRRIVSHNLLGQRKVQLNERRYFYQDILTSRFNILKNEAQGLKKVQQAIQKRQKRVSEHQQILDGMNQLQQVKWQVEQNQPPVFQSEVVATSQKSMKLFKQCEEHYSGFFSDQTHIPDDEFLKNRYQEVQKIIESNVNAFNDLVDQKHLRENLIEQYQKFKQTLENDHKILKQYQKIVRKQGIEDTYNLLVFKVQDKQKNQQILEETKQFKNFEAKIHTTLNAIMNKYIKFLISQPQFNRASFVIFELLKIIRMHEPQLNQLQPIVYVGWQKYIESSFHKLVLQYSHKISNDPINQHPSNNSSSLGATPRQKITLSDTKKINTFKSQRGPFLTTRKITNAARRRNDSDLNLKNDSHYNESNYKNSEYERFSLFQDICQFINQLNQTTIMISSKNFRFLISYEDALDHIRQDKALSQIYKKLSSKNVRKYLAQINQSSFHTRTSNSNQVVSREPSNHNINMHDQNINLQQNSIQCQEVDYVDPITRAIDRDALIHDKLIEDSQKRQILKEKELERRQNLLKDEDKKRLDKVKFMKHQRELKQFERDELIFQKNYKSNINRIFDNFYQKSIISDPQDTHFNLEGIQPAGINLIADDVNLLTTNDIKIEPLNSNKVKASQSHNQGVQKQFQSFQHSPSLQIDKPQLQNKEQFQSGNLSNVPFQLNQNSSLNSSLQLDLENSLKYNQYKKQLTLKPQHLSETAPQSPILQTRKSMGFNNSLTINSQQLSLEKQASIQSNGNKKVSNNQLLAQAIRRRESVKEQSFQPVKIERMKKKEQSIILQMLQDKFPEMIKLSDQNRYQSLTARISPNQNSSGINKRLYEEHSNVDYLDENSNEDQETHSQNSSINYGHANRDSSRRQIEDIDNLDLQRGFIKVKKIYSKIDLPHH